MELLLVTFIFTCGVAVGLFAALVIVSREPAPQSEASEE